MIEVKRICTCDRCEKIVPDGHALYRISRSLVPIYTTTECATRSISYHDGLCIKLEDDYKAYHLCSSCVDDLRVFMEPD